MNKSLGIAIPCYNESPALAELLRRLSSPPLRTIEFVLVDNGSTDTTSEILSGAKLPPNISWIRIPVNKGYGFGVLAGLNELKTNYVGWTHADLQSDPMDLLLFLEHLDSSIEFLKGRRTGRPRSDRFFTASMSIILSMMFGRSLRDINGQPTVLCRTLYDKWKEPPHDFGLDLFCYINAVRNRAKIVRVKVHFGKRIHGKSSWNSGFYSRLRFIHRTLRLALAIRFSIHD